MKRVLSLVVAFAVLAIFSGAVVAAPVAGGKGSLATITGSVKDDKGKPVAGAVVDLLKEGAKEIVKQIKTDAAGKFTTKVAPGVYGLRAIAKGFNEVIFSSVEVRPSQELVYSFNLEPIGEGRTLPEQRRDRDDVKWTLRSSQTRRSIFQAQEEEAEDIRTILAADTNGEEMIGDPESDVRISTFDSRPRALVETYFANNPFGFSYTGLNFAVATPASENIDLVFAGQTGVGEGAPGRLEALGRVRSGDHRVTLAFAGLRFATPVWLNDDDQRETQGQLSVRAVDEWVVRDGVVIVFGLDYSRFVGGSDAFVISPRFGMQFDAGARTRLKLAYAPGGKEGATQSIAGFEDTHVTFIDPSARPIAYVDGQAVMEKSHRLEFGVERVLDNHSNVEATAFFDTTSGRGVGFLSLPISALSPTANESLIKVANQQGAARGMRLVYTRRLNRVWTASGGYSFGRGQRLAANGSENPAELFENGFFQTAAVQVGAGFRTGTNVRTVLRFSPQATVFAIDPFAGQLGVYDPSLSIQVTQDLPNFGLPVRAEAVLDARNLMDAQANSETNEILTQFSTGRRSVRGGISVRF